MRTGKLIATALMALCCVSLGPVAGEQDDDMPVDAADRFDVDVQMEHRADAPQIPTDVIEARKQLSQVRSALTDFWADSLNGSAKYDAAMAGLTKHALVTLEGVRDLGGHDCLAAKILEIAIDRKKHPSAYEDLREAVRVAGEQQTKRKGFALGVNAKFKTLLYRLAWEEILIRPLGSKELTMTEAMLALDGLGIPGSLEAYVASYVLSWQGEGHRVIRARLLGSIVGFRKAAGEERALAAVCDCYAAAKDKSEWRDLVPLMSKEFSPKLLAESLKAVEQKVELLKNISGAKERRGGETEESKTTPGKIPEK